MINISEAKTHLSKYAKMVREGRRIILCDRNKPFAEIRPIVTGEDGLRPYGLAAGQIVVPDDFNEEDGSINSMFEGGV